MTDDPVSDDLTSNLSSEVRSIDGTGNNLENAEFRATDTELLRVAENDYADGISEPAGEDRPSAREISNVLSAADPDGTTSERNLSSFVFAWGQFLDHSIGLRVGGDEEVEVSFDESDPLESFNNRSQNPAIQSHAFRQALPLIQAQSNLPQ